LWSFYHYMSTANLTSDQTAQVTSNPPIQVSQCGKILVVKLDNIGDFVLTTPFLRGLRKSAPQSQIDLIVSPNVLPLAEICPLINRVIGSEVKQTPDNQITIVHSGRPENIELHKIDCQSRSYDLAIVPLYDEDVKLSFLVAAYSGAKRIVGFSAPEGRSAIRQDYAKLFYTDVLHRPVGAHEVEHYDALLNYVNGNSDIGPVDIWTLQEDISSISQMLTSLGMTTAHPLLAICPGASDPRKSLPPDKLARILLRVEEVIPHVQFLILGGEAEQVYAQTLQSSLTICFDLCNRIAPRELVAAISLSTAVVAVDNDQAHIAAAIDRPSIVISCHPSDADLGSRFSPNRFKPWGKADCIVLQPNRPLWPCNLWPIKQGCQAGEPHCIMSILDEDVAQVIMKLVQNQSQNLIGS
jgi:heptosyltransferase III